MFSRSPMTMSVILAGGVRDNGMVVGQSGMRVDRSMKGD